MKKETTYWLEGHVSLFRVVRKDNGRFTIDTFCSLDEAGLIALRNLLNMVDADIHGRLGGDLPPFEWKVQYEAKPPDVPEPHAPAEGSWLWAKALMEAGKVCGHGDTRYKIVDDEILYFDVWLEWSRSCLNRLTNDNTRDMGAYKTGWTLVEGE